ncbi:hypothetical protein [Sebaldella sp. S0638]|uniref:hypothetical protein n=1 Tax=Sebaldella sp. S0638 TaxID=2957809 RepID=UPI00209D0086|nr:hypothetical protein [Sebaldella sp. S0638]MCP1223704.1 hypothetical protein [Sebaldella sp. S0638]
MSVLINARTFTQEEKKEMVKQFYVFQQALENKDIKTIIAMTELPTKELTALITDEMGNVPEEYEYGKKAMTAKDMEKYKERIFDNLKPLLYIKVDPNSGKITNYFKNNATEEDKKRKYYFDAHMSSYYYMEKNTKKYLETGRIWDDRVELQYADEGLFAIEYWTPNKLTPKEPEGDGGTAYEFKFEKNKLKLYLIYWND